MLSPNKIINFPLLLIAIFALFNNRQSIAQCQPKHIAKIVKNNLRPPYLYGASELTKITFDDKAKQKTIEFTALADVKYRIIFCSSNFEEMVKVNIYDSDNKNVTQNKVFDNAQGIDNNYWVFDPPKEGNYHVIYDIPPSIDGTVRSGCIVLIIGYSEEEETTEISTQ